MATSRASSAWSKPTGCAEATAAASSEAKQSAGRSLRSGRILPIEYDGFADSPNCQDGGAGGAPGLEVPVRLGRRLQRELLVDVGLQHASPDEVEDVGRAGQEVLALGRVGAEGGTRQVERALARHNSNVEGRRRARGGSKQCQQAEGRKAVQRQ